MQEQYINVPLGGLPLNLMCFGDGTVALQPTQPHKGIIDGNVRIFQDGLQIAGSVYQYGFRYAYKEMPELKSWLANQKLTMPNFAPQEFQF